VVGHGLPDFQAAFCEVSETSVVSCIKNYYRLHPALPQYAVG
jgi:hypothetical protein